MDKIEFITDIDYNKSSEACTTCSSECKKIEEKINGRELSNLEKNEINEILKLFTKRERLIP